MLLGCRRSMPSSLREGRSRQLQQAQQLSRILQHLSLGFAPEGQLPSLRAYKQSASSGAPRTAAVTTCLGSRSEWRAPAGAPFTFSGEPPWTRMRWRSGISLPQVTSLWTGSAWLFGASTPCLTPDPIPASGAPKDKLLAAKGGSSLGPACPLARALIYAAGMMTCLCCMPGGDLAQNGSATAFGSSSCG